MEGIILLEDVMRLLQAKDQFGRPIPVSLTAIAQDLHRKTGGTRIIYSKAVLANQNAGGKKNYDYRNNTINIKGFGNNEVRAIHPILITHCNGQEVAI
jgi:hypothetical protein